MKRPLLWAVALFALGEVISIYAGSIMMVSIIFVMLICLALFMVSKFKDFNLRLALILFLCCQAGFLNVQLRDGEKEIVQILSEVKEEYGEKREVDVSGYEENRGEDVSDYVEKSGVYNSD